MVAGGRRTPSLTWNRTDVVWMGEGCDRSRVGVVLELVVETVMMMGDVMSRRMSILWLLRHELYEC